MTFFERFRNHPRLQVHAKLRLNRHTGCYPSYSRSGQNMISSDQLSEIRMTRTVRLPTLFDHPPAGSRHEPKW